jgi:preprotein translocase subunit Sss1
MPTAEGSKAQVPDFCFITGVTMLGFVAFGLIAFVVKVVHAPITQILLG